VDGGLFLLGPAVAQETEWFQPRSGGDRPVGRDLRQQQSGAGRRCAARLLERMGARDTQVPVGPHGCPQWPAGFVGSITHTDDFVAVAVARQSDYRSLGIDSERLVPPEAAADIEAICLDLSERRLALSASLERHIHATLCFCAKESLYKCLYPMVGRFFDHAAAKVVLVDLASGSLTLRLDYSLAAGLPLGLELRTRFRIEPSHVYTSLELQI
jgi:enterobactin synthetase component D